MRIGIECGGTFTDLVVLDEDGTLIATDKVFSTPADPSLAVSAALAGLQRQLLAHAELLHGSTIATNALIERRGAHVGLLVTRGFADIIFLQRQDRDEMYNLRLIKPQPLVQANHVLEVHERTIADGTVVTALDERSVREAARRLTTAGVTAVAVCLLHSYANPRNEERVREILRQENPSWAVTLSSECAREFREYERTTTTTVDAFLKPRIGAYLGRLEDHAREREIASLRVMQSNGGMVPVSTAAQNPLTMLRSGPAAGVAGAIAVCENIDLGDIVTMDMGGTSTDVAVIRGGRPDLTTETVIDGLPVRVPMVDIVAVGAGGGSIVGIDSGGLLTVGPQSAGADPGPVCYRRGGKLPTVTDANVVRGLVRPDAFLGGRHSLDRDAAVTALIPLADRLGRSVERLAEDAYQLAGVHMATAIRMTTTERGHEVGGYTLCAYGGAGALHAASVADQLGIRRVLIPPHNGLASAYGLLTAGFRREFSRTRMAIITEQTDASLTAMWTELRHDALHRLRSEGIPSGEATLRYAADLRYAGQGFEVLADLGEHVPSRPDLLERFEAVQRRRYGYTDPGKSVQLVTGRLTVSLPRPRIELPRVQIDTTLPVELRPIIEQGAWVEATFRARRSLPTGSAQAGPAVLEDPTSTTFVPTGWTAEVDQKTNLVLERGM